MDDEYKLYAGLIMYHATGEGHHHWFYINYARSEEQFKQMMFKDLDIDEYYHVGLEIYDKSATGMPLILRKHFDAIEPGDGFFKMHFYVNYA